MNAFCTELIKIDNESGVSDTVITVSETPDSLSILI